MSDLDDIRNRINNLGQTPQPLRKKVLPHWRKVVRVRTRLVWRRTRRSTVAWIRTSWARIKKSLRVRAKLLRRRARRNGYATTTGVIVLIAFVALVVWLNQMAGGVIDQLKLIPYKYLWWGLGTLLAIALLVGIVRAGGASYVGRTATTGWLWKPAVAVLILIAGVYGVRRFYFTTPTTTVGRAVTDDAIFDVTAKKGVWSEVYHFPPTGRVSIRAERPSGSFAIKTQDGAIYSFTPEKSDVVPGVIASASVTAIGESEEKIHIRLYH